MRRFRLVLPFLAALALVCSPLHSSATEEKTFTVPPGKRTVFEIELNSEKTVRGKFSASGGSGDDIECFIMDKENYENQRHNRSADIIWKSGRTTAGKFKLTLEEGTYYVIFSNTFSIVSEKVVTFELDY